MATAVVEVSSTSVRAGLACGAASTPQILRPSACAQSGERPVSQGCIVDQPLWEATLHDTLTHLLGGEQGEWGERKLMLVQRPGAPRPGSARAAEFVFERCGLGHLRLVDSAVTGLLATGRPTGIVVDCGYDSSHVATVYEGYTVHEARVQEVDIGGLHLTRIIQQSRLLAHLQLTEAEANMLRERAEQQRSMPRSSRRIEVGAGSLFR